jgi:uncharacterized damage-inducible protein DinB
MRKSDVMSLIDYMYWANERILDAAERLSTEAFLATTSLTTRSLRATLVHELDVEWSWRLNLQSRLSEGTEELRPDDYANLAAIREHWRGDEAEMRAWLDAMTDADMEAPVDSELSRDSRPLWQYLGHIVFHAAQQQSDAATLLTIAGESPGELGYLEFLRRE